MFSTILISFLAAFVGLIAARLVYDAARMRYYRRLYAVKKSEFASGQLRKAALAAALAFAAVTIYRRYVSRSVDSFMNG